MPPGPPVLSPDRRRGLRARRGGPPCARGARARARFAATPDMVGIDDSIEEAAPRVVLRVDQRKAALAGVAPRDVVADAAHRARRATTSRRVHDGAGQVRSAGADDAAAEQQGRLDESSLTCGARRDGHLVPLSELVHVARGEREKTDLPQGPAAGGLRRRRHGGRRGQPAVRHVRCAKRRRGARGPQRRPARRALHPPARPIRTAGTRSSGTASGR